MKLKSGLVTVQAAYDGSAFVFGKLKVGDLVVTPADPGVRQGQPLEAVEKP